jgi:hypothetical protein
MSDWSLVTTEPELVDQLLALTGRRKPRYFWIPKVMDMTPVNPGGMLSPLLIRRDLRRGYLVDSDMRLYLPRRESGCVLPKRTSFLSKSFKANGRRGIYNGHLSCDSVTILDTEGAAVELHRDIASFAAGTKLRIFTTAACSGHYYELIALASLPGKLPNNDYSVYYDERQDMLWIKYSDVPKLPEWFLVHYESSEREPVLVDGRSIPNVILCTTKATVELRPVESIRGVLTHLRVPKAYPYHFSVTDPPRLEKACFGTPVMPARIRVDIPELSTTWMQAMDMMNCYFPRFLGSEYNRIFSQHTPEKWLPYLERFNELSKAENITTSLADVRLEHLPSFRLRTATLEQLLRNDQALAECLRLGYAITPPAQPSPGLLPPMWYRRTWDLTKLAAFPETVEALFSAMDNAPSRLDHRLALMVQIHNYVQAYPQVLEMFVSRHGYAQHELLDLIAEGKLPPHQATQA